MKKTTNYTLLNTKAQTRCLTVSEAFRKLIALKEVSISVLQEEELVGDDTAERLSHQAVFEWRLQQAADIQVNVVRMSTRNVTIPFKNNLAGKEKKEVGGVGWWLRYSYGVKGWLTW